MRLFDLHCDTLTQVTRELPSLLYEPTGGLTESYRGTFAPWVQTMAVWLPDTVQGTEAVSLCFRQFAAAEALPLRHPQQFRLLRNTHPTEDFSGCQMMLSVENAGAMGEYPRLPERLAEKGVRLASFTWNGDNAWAGGCGGAGVGLTSLGRQMLTELENQSITVDVSHMHEQGFWEVAKCSHRPLVASHSNAAAIFSHPRNLTDDQFLAVRESGGLVGLNLYPGHLGKPTCEQFQWHLEHFLSLDGEKTVCIGSDFDGFTLPAGYHGVSMLQSIWLHLTRQGYPIPLLEDIFYKNAYRFFFGEK